MRFGFPAKRWIVEQAAVDRDPARHARELLARLADRPGAVAEVQDVAAYNRLVQVSIKISLALLPMVFEDQFVALGRSTRLIPIVIR